MPPSSASAPAAFVVKKAALWMRADGMDNVLQLDGGILGYFEAVGGEGYEGGCFVFDERVALDPQLRPLY